jgi:hypothetical protein
METIADEKAYIHRLPVTSWTGACSESLQQEAVNALEGGRVVYLPQLSFELKPEEKRFLSPSIVDGAKNVSFNSSTGKIGGCSCQDGDRAELASLMRRFAEHAQQLLGGVIPSYRNKAIVGRTSLRPVEIAGRASSWRKDDTRLHVDSFPATPVHGRRILRVFSNVNPDGKPRCWRVGQPFDAVAERFARDLRAPFPGSAAVMRLFHITRGLRTPYDHYMLRMHDRMKADPEYQGRSPQLHFSFPPNTTWMVFTDQVPHAASSGQHQFEQTFYLEVEDMQNPNRSPLRVLERLIGAKLVN